MCSSYCVADQQPRVVFANGARSMFFPFSYFLSYKEGLCYISLVN